MSAEAKLSFSVSALTALQAIAACFAASGKKVCYPFGCPSDDPDLVHDEDWLNSYCVGPKPGCPCDRSTNDSE